jgi:hypothetical protein
MATETVPSVLCSIELRLENGFERWLVTSPRLKSKMPYNNMNDAFDYAMMADCGIIIEKILLCQWMDINIDAIMGAWSPKVANDYERKAYPIIEAVYILLCRNCIDKHLKAWQVLDAHVMEFLTFYGS